tara:strand:- start:677 stop:2143 length:1467 start_codon:yes stop_codon:yes gene_type:complete
MKKPAVVWRRKRASSKLLQSMDKPIFRPLPSQAPEKDFFVSECASVEKESVNIVTYGDCVGSASAPHAPSGARVAKPQRGYPCLTDNNSINDDIQELRYQRERKKREDKFYKDVIKPILTGYQNKATDMLQYRIEKGCAEHGEKSMGVLHLTFAEDVDYQTAQDRINSLATNIFRKRYKINGLNYYIPICEKGSKNGRIHFHVLFIKEGADFKTGTRFQWSKLKKRENIFPNDELRAEWEFYQSVLTKYGFGKKMVRVEPLKTVEGGARYFSKYVGKGHYTRDESMKGKQLIRPSNGFRKYFGTKEIGGKKFTAQEQINYVGGISSGRRVVLADLGATLSCDDVVQLNYKLGPHWQHYCKDQIRACACLAGYRIGPNSKDFVFHYAKNRWGIQVVFGLHENDHEIEGGAIGGTWMSRVDLYEFALDKLLDRIEVAEEFQYDERVPVAQRLEPNNEKKSNGTCNKQRNDGDRYDREPITKNNETLTFNW